MRSLGWLARLARKRIRLRTDLATSSVGLGRSVHRTAGCCHSWASPIGGDLRSRAHHRRSSGAVIAVDHHRPDQALVTSLVIYAASPDRPAIETRHAMNRLTGKAPARQALDLPDLCRPFDGGEVQRALSAAISPRARPASPSPSICRPRPATTRDHPLGPGRGRQGRRAGLASRRHAGAVRGHSARRDEHVDDDQRDGGVAACALYRASPTSRARARSAAGHDPERHHQGISLARHLCVSARAVDAADQGHDPVHVPRDAEMESDECLLLSSAGSRRDAGAGTAFALATAIAVLDMVQDSGAVDRGEFRRGGRAHLVLRQCRHALHHRDLQDARLRRDVGRDHARALRRQRSEATRCSAMACR